MRTSSLKRKSLCRRLLSDEEVAVYLRAISYVGGEPGPGPVSNAPVGVVGHLVVVNLPRLRKRDVVRPQEGLQAPDVVVLGEDEGDLLDGLALACSSRMRWPRLAEATRVAALLWTSQLPFDVITRRFTLRP
jgi:hypothetical protein